MPTQAHEANTWVRFHTAAGIRSWKSQLKTFGDSLTTSFPYLLRYLFLSDRFFARAFLQLGYQVWSNPWNETACPASIQVIWSCLLLYYNNKLQIPTCGQHLAQSFLQHFPAMGATQSTSRPPHVPRVRFRVLIIGRANAGKTSILQRVCDTTESPVIYRSDLSGTRERVCVHSQWRIQSHHDPSRLVSTPQ